MEELTIGSLFAGIGGFDFGFEQAGFKTIWQVEIEPFCQAVLKTHFPHAELFNDVTECGKHNLKPVTVLTGGFPCQDLSVAGKRAGLGGSRSGLFWHVVRILEETKPKFFILENVPGLFSSWSDAEEDTAGENTEEQQTLYQTNDFDTVLKALSDLGYGLAWRVFDSQFFGVAQRRRRVFIVGYLGAPCPAEILFESESGGGNTSPGRKKRSRVAQEASGGIAGSLAPRDWKGADNIYAEEGKLIPTIVNCLAPVGGGPDDNDAQAGHIIVIQDVRGGTRDRTDSGQGIGIREGGPSYTLSRTEQHAIAFGANDSGQDVGFDVSPTIRCGGKDGGGVHTAVAFSENQRGEIRTSDISPQLTTGGGKPGQGYPAVAFALKASDGHHGHSSPRRDGCDNQVVAHPLRAGRLSADSHGDQGNVVTAIRPANTSSNGWGILQDGTYHTFDQTGGDFICSPSDADGMRDFAGLPEGLDSARYRALGNAVTTRVIAWIADRIRNTLNVQKVNMILPENNQADWLTEL